VEAERAQVGELGSMLNSGAPATKGIAKDAPGGWNSQGFEAKSFCGNAA
jgi:hypothetical protein